jgi:hypothetical protein
VEGFVTFTFRRGVNISCAYVHNISCVYVHNISCAYVHNISCAYVHIQADLRISVCVSLLILFPTPNFKSPY